MKGSYREIHLMLLGFVCGIVAGALKEGEGLFHGSVLSCSVS